MNPTLKNILAVIAGIVIGSAVNGGIISVSGSIIPPPPGVDVTTAEGLKAGMHLFQPINFLMPFLAHALGSLAGAFTTAWIAANRKLLLALLIGLFFLVGGTAMIFMVPSPLWFTITDLALAYLLMAWIGYKISPK